MLREVFGGPARHQNMTGIAAIHAPLRQVNSGASDIGAAADIGHGIDCPAVNSHPQPEVTCLLRFLADLNRGLSRSFRAIAKNECHAIASRKFDQTAILLGRFDGGTTSHRFVQRLQ